MKVRALTDGFCGGIRRREGEVFDFAGEKPAKWMKPVDAEEAPQPVRPVDADEATLSGIARRGHAVEMEGIKRKSARS